MNGLIMALARSPLRRLVGRHTVVLCYTAPKSGRAIELAVEAVADDDGWLIAVGHSEHKSWWKAFRRPLPASLQTGHRTRAVTGQLLTGADREVALTAYVQSRGRSVETETPIVRLRPGSTATPTA